jgi:hypothetical protein
MGSRVIKNPLGQVKPQCHTRVNQNPAFFILPFVVEENFCVRVEIKEVGLGFDSMTLNLISQKYSG